MIGLGSDKNRGKRNVKKQNKKGEQIATKKYKKGKKKGKRWKTLRSEPLWIARGGITPIIILSWSLPSKIHTLQRIFCKYNKISKLIFENGYFSRRHHLILFCFKSVKSLRSLLYFMLSGVERIGYHLDFTETAELCYQMLKPVGAAPGKQVQVLKGLWEKCSSAQIEEFPWRLSQGSLSPPTFEKVWAISNKPALLRACSVGNAGKTSVEMFYGCACSGGQKKVHIRCIGREARLPGGTRPRMAQGHHQPSTTTFLDPFPPHFIFLSSSIYFSFLLT